MEINNSSEKYQVWTNIPKTGTPIIKILETKIMDKEIQTRVVLNNGTAVVINEELELTELQNLTKIQIGAKIPETGATIEEILDTVIIAEKIHANVILDDGTIGCINEELKFYEGPVGGEKVSSITKLAKGQLKDFGITETVKAGIMWIIGKADPRYLNLEDGTEIAPCDDENMPEEEQEEKGCQCPDPDRCECQED